jgi:histidinol-phosphate aminotransferase
VAALAEYDPPESRERAARRLGIPPEQVIKLDANENPYGPAPGVVEALKAGRYEEYCDPDQQRVRAALADYVGVGPEHLLLGNGSDELIDLLMRAYLDPGDEVLTFTPTFGMYGFNAQHYAGRLVEVERDARFDVPLQQALAAIGPRTRLIFLTAPNNPTGNQVPESIVQALLDTGRLVVLDEAYAEFAGRSLASWVPARDNLVVLRTFSKWAALAGLRAGYGVLPRGVARHLWKLKPPFNINVAAEVAVLKSLGQRDWLLANVARLVDERERLILALDEVPYLRPYPSEGNFVLTEVVGRDAAALKRALADRGILVRHYRTARIASCIRITVGRPQDSEALLATFANL